MYIEITHRDPYIMNENFSPINEYLAAFAAGGFDLVFHSDPDGLVPPEYFDYHIHKYWELKFSSGLLRIQAPHTVHCTTGYDHVFAVTPGCIRAGEAVLNISEDENIYNFLPELLDTLHRLPPGGEFDNIRKHLGMAVIGNLQLILKKLQWQAEYNSNRRDLVSRVLSYMGNHYFHSDLNVNDIARFAGISPQHLNTLLRQRTGMGIRQNLIRIRLENAAELLENPAYMVKDAAALTGWKSVFYFGNSFRRHFGVSPGNYRKQHIPEKQPDA